MMKYFSKLGLCFRPRRSSSLTDDSYLIPIHRSDDYVRVGRKRASRYSHLQSPWRPELSAIVEDGEVQDHDNERKSEKSSGKSRSTAEIACFHERRNKGDSKPLLFVSLFSSSPFMF